MGFGLITWIESTYMAAEMILKDTYVGTDGRPSPFDVTFADAEHTDEIVIFLHGYKGYKDWGAWGLVAMDFARAGMDFLKFNFSHNGGTVESPIDFPDLDAFSKNTYSKELFDARAVVDMVESGLERNGKIVRYEKIHLIGHSRGGGIAILSALNDPRVSKLVTWSAVSDFSERFNFDLEKWKKEGVAYVRNSRTKQDMPHRFEFYTDFQENREKLDIPSAAQKINQPWLIAHAENDEAVCFSNADYLKSLNRRAELLMIKNTGHTFGAKHPWKDSSLPEPLQDLVDKTIEFIRS